MGCVNCVPAGGETDDLLDDRNDTIYVAQEFSSQEKLPHTIAPRSAGVKYSMKDFTVLNLIGKGAFGKVYLVEKNISKRLYAIKVLNKENIKAKKQILHTQAERQILENMKNHPFIIQLHCAFQSRNKLYMVMDFMQGGELFFHIRQATQFTEVRAMFYCAQIVLALEHLHRNQIIYRDLKPENILMDKEGNIKIADFGLSKLGINENIKTTTICGTPEYLAPEIFRNLGHDKTADWWSLGALLYEMLTGAPPFYSRNKEKMLQNILQKPIEMKSYFSKESKSILSGLLQIDPSRRLGSDNDAEDLKQHAFFRYVNWQKMSEKKYDPPFKPRLNGPKDLKYIDKIFKYEVVHETEDSLRGVFNEEELKKSHLTNNNEGFENFTITIGTIKPSVGSFLA